ncbi:MAG: sensor histidine kinase, partial [Pontixanthobacter sp.]
MRGSDGNVSVCGTTDMRDHLVEADELLAQLQWNCGGDLPGLIAIPELQALVAKSRESGVKSAKGFYAFDGRDHVYGWAEITPRRGPQGGCDVAIRDWRTEHENDQDGGNADRLYIIDRAASE